MIKRILGLDVSLSITGFAVIDINTETCECSVVKIGSTNTTKISGRGNKLNFIYRQMVYLNETFSPEDVVIEKPFSLHNVSTQAIFSAIGAVQMALCEIEPIWYSANELKKYVAGHGHSDKSRVAEALKDIFPGIEFANNDESDALGVVITHMEVSEEFTTNG